MNWLFFAKYWTLLIVIYIVAVVMHTTTPTNEGGIYNSQATVNIFYINLDMNTNLKNLIDTKPGHVFKQVKKKCWFLTKIAI